MSEVLLVKALNVLLVEDSPDYSSLVVRWLSSNPGPAEFALIWTDTLASALARLEQNDIDLMLADLGLPDSDGLATFDALRAKAGDVPIIVLSAGDSEALAIQTIQYGAQDYLVKSTCTPELLFRTLRHALVRHQSVASRVRSTTPAHEESNKKRTIIGVVGVSGGAGATTVACVLAAELRRHTDEPTLLIDLDANPGLIAFMTGIDPQYCVQDAVNYADGLDRSLWERLVVQGPGNIDILASSKKYPDAEADAASLQKVVAFAGNCYRWVVMDLGRLNKTSQHLLSSADNVTMVSTDSIPALHQCKHAIEILRDQGIGDQRTRLILNQKDAVDHLSGKQIENMFGVPIEAILPPSHEELHSAFVQTQLPSITGNFRTKISGVARKIAGLPEVAPKRSLLSLTSLRDRFQRRGKSNDEEMVS